MAGTTIRVGPIALTTSIQNAYNPPTGTGGTPTGQITPYGIIRQVHLANKSGSAASVTGYIGASSGSAAGTEVFPTKSIAANDVYDLYGAWRMDAADYLTMSASANTALVATITVEIIAK